MEGRAMWDVPVQEGSGDQGAGESTAREGSDEKRGVRGRRGF